MNKKINKNSIRFKILVPIMLLMLAVLSSTFILLEHYKNAFVADQIKYGGESIITSVINALETVESKNQLKQLITKFTTNNKINYIYIFDQTGAIYVGDSSLPEGSNISSIALDNKDKIDLIINGYKVKNEPHLELFKNNYELIMVTSVNLNFRMIDNVKLQSLRILVSIDGSKTYNKVSKIILAWEIIYFTAFLLVSSLLYLLIRRYILSPVEKLVTFIKNLKAHPTPLEEVIPDINFRSDELAILGTTLFAQVKELNDQQQSILERNQKLFEINEQLKEATITKQTFLANMSHEIRTPLSGIIGVSELLAETSLDERQKKYSSIIEHSSKSLLSIVNDILDFSLIEARKINFENRVFKLNDLLKDIYDSFKVLANKKEISLEMILDINKSTIVCSDSFRITQILNNLIGNALKFTTKGSIEIVVKNNTTSRKGNYLFTIRDTGIGMSKEQLEKLFRSFEQTDGSITRKFGGTGLGLVISKSIVELMGGEIWAESNKDIGSIFYFTLNLPLSETDKQLSPPNLMTESNLNTFTKVLIVDDNEVNRLIANAFLTKRFKNVFQQNDGQLAYDFYTKECPGIVFMDLQMPNMDGVTAMKLIRNYEAEHSLPPCLLIALTANALAEEKRIALSSGFNYYLTKPLNQKTLNALIDELAEKLK